MVRKYNPKTLRKGNAVKGLGKARRIILRPRSAPKGRRKKASRW